MQQAIKSVTVETDLTLHNLPELHQRLSVNLSPSPNWELQLAYSAEVDTAGLQWLCWLQKSISPSILTVKVSAQHRLIQLLAVYQVTPPFQVQISG